MDKYRIEAENTVLLIIDLQEKLMRAMSEKDKVYKSHELLLGLANTFKIPVIACRQYPQGLGGIVPEIADKLPEWSYTYDKVQFSAMLPELKQILGKINRKKIIITGTETHVCVFQTSRDLIEAGYNVQVPQDAVCSRFKADYLNGLDLIKNMGAVISNSETIAFDMLKQAGTPEFKEVSKLFK